MDFSLNGSDTISLTYQGETILLTQFADKDYGMLSFPNELATMKVGKSGNAVISFNNMGLMGELTLRLLVGNTQDAALNSIQRDFIGDAPSFQLVSGQIVKRSGDGAGNVNNVIYYLQGGVPTTIPEEHSSADGDEEQGIAVWKFKFAQGARQIM
jgi:hypothetical protein